MAIKGGRPVDRQISVVLFVRHGDEERAINFYSEVLNADVLLRHELPDGTPSGADLKIGTSVISVTGANPKRDADATLGGPRSPNALGTTATILNLYVDDVDAVMAQAVRAGGVVRNPVEDAVWGDRVGVFIDPFGHIWALFKAQEEVEPGDIAKRVRQSQRQRQDHPQASH